ncbi:hypothetical protein IAT38_001186 [Cryptococcus sp. DSM 104549]
MIVPKTVVTTVFLALVLDLLAFTIPLPLFPRLIAWYMSKETAPDALINRLLSLCHAIRTGILNTEPAISRWTAAYPALQKPLEWLLLGGSKSIAGVTESHKNWDVVLLGGLMGSLFSFCQCIISPWLGRLADRYGRKKVLLATMVGNILSAVIWIQSTSFASYLLSRLVAGLSEGNVQLSTAIIGDVTTEASRSRSLALVGIAFSICFTLGPSLGAYFASRPHPLPSVEDRFNVYALPALLSLALLLVETLYLAIVLPETKGFKAPETEPVVAKEGEKVDGVQSPAATETKAGAETPASKLRRLKEITNLHGYFLLLFSGAEFTLTFLTYDMFAASNAYNGRLLSYIGILAAFIQARRVRPSMARIGEIKVATHGIATCVVGLLALSTIPITKSWSISWLPHVQLYVAATCLAMTSASVVTGLTAGAAKCCDEERAELKRGRAMGTFRSRGQLGRAVGPLIATGLYWLRGPTTAYLILGVALGLVLHFAPKGKLAVRSTKKTQ